MKILVATALLQGSRSNDHHYFIEGELVWMQDPCAKSRDDPDGPCVVGVVSQARHHIERPRPPWSWSRT